MSGEYAEETDCILVKNMYSETSLLIILCIVSLFVKWDYSNIQLRIVMRIKYDTDKPSVPGVR